GALAKGALKDALYDAAAAGWLVPWLAASSFATALLMLRVFSLARGQRPAPGQAVPAVHPAWWLLVALAATVPWLQAASGGMAKLPALADAWDALWPAALALAVSLAWQMARREAGRRQRRSAWPAIPEG